MKLSQFVYSWLERISIVFIIISLFNLIMPKGNLKKFVNLVIGLLVIIVVISPFIDLLKFDYNFDEEVFNQLYNQSAQIDQGLLENQNEEIESLYIDRIRQNIKGLVETNSDYRVSDLVIDIHREKENYGLIKEIDISLTSGDTIEPQDGKIKIDNVKVVSLENKELADTKKFLDEDLVNLIAREFGIHKDNINIHIIN